jgi:hypothetical protein
MAELTSNDEYQRTNGDSQSWCPSRDVGLSGPARKLTLFANLRPLLPTCKTLEPLVGRGSNEVAVERRISAQLNELCPSLDHTVEIETISCMTETTDKH